MVKSKDVEPCWCRGTISLDTGSNYKLHGLSTAGILHPENSHVVQDKSICKNNSDVVLRILERDIKVYSSLIFDVRIKGHFQSFLFPILTITFLSLPLSIILITWFLSAWFYFCFTSCDCNWPSAVLVDVICEHHSSGLMTLSPNSGCICYSAFTLSRG